MNEFVGVVLAAGHGKRMKSDLPKMLHPVGGIPMVKRVVEVMKQAGVGRCLAVVGYKKEAVMDCLGDSVEYVIQEEQLGTGHALLQARGQSGSARHLLVLCGDTPLLTADTLKGFIEAHSSSGAAVTVLTARVDDPYGYGRIVRDRSGNMLRIVEQADATPEEAAIKEVNTGIYCFDALKVFKALGSVSAANSQKEYYLVDVIPIMLGQGERVRIIEASNEEEVLGVNNRSDLARAEAVLRKRVIEELWRSGVTIPDPSSVFIDERAQVGTDSVILPFSIIEGPCQIGEGCRIGPGAHLVSSKVGNNAQVIHSMIEQSEIGEGVSIGPYSHLRSNSVLGNGVKVGNFAEIKNSRVGDGTKIPHHSYLGDAVVGSGVNIGAGAITVNYDGVDKNPTIIGDRAFIGCNANLIAPVTVQEGGYVAAGSTVNRDVPSGALAIARPKQENKAGWAEKVSLKRKQKKGQE